MLHGNRVGGSPEIGILPEFSAAYLGQAYAKVRRVWLNRGFRHSNNMGAMPLASHAVSLFFPGAENDAAIIQLEHLFRENERRFSEGHTLALEGDQNRTVLCVLKGWLAVAKRLSDGEKQIIDFALPGDIMETSAADGKSAALEIEALTDVSVAVLSDTTWQETKRDWQVLHRLAFQIAAASRARRAERMLRLGKGSARMRLAYALLELCVRLRAIGHSEGCHFHVPLTQQHLGDFAGLTSVHVCRTLRGLARQGIIAVADHMDIRILDVAALAEIADVEAEALSREIVPAASLSQNGAPLVPCALLMAAICSPS